MPLKARAGDSAQLGDQHGVVRREQFRHKVSAFFKRLRGQAAPERM